jgi:hypothetical protein
MQLLDTNRNPDELYVGTWRPAALVLWCIQQFCGDMCCFSAAVGGGKLFMSGMDSRVA